jgi:hypothetical protein
MEEGRTADNHRAGANAHEWTSDGMSDVNADCCHSSPASSVAAHGSPTTVMSSAARMTADAPAAARENGVRAYQQRHSKQNRKRSFHRSLLRGETGL